MKQKKQKHIEKKLATCAAALTILLALILLCGRLWFRLPISAYYKASQPAFTLPDIANGYVPQGMAYVPEQDFLLLTGHFCDHSASPLYSIGINGESPKRVALLHADGTPAASHNGGITTHNGLIYICDSGEPVLRVFRLSDLLAAQDGGAIREIDVLPLRGENDLLIPAFVEATEEGLVVGEFYRPVAYETPTSHYVGGNHALAVLLPYDDSGLGVSSVPVRAWSLPDQAQGMCFDDRGLMYISESWGASFSVIDVFNASAADETHEVIDVLGTRVPLTTLDERSRVTSAKIAPMSEEIVFLDGQLYVNCESACQKYLFGWLNGAHKLYKTDIAFFRGN